MHSAATRILQSPVLMVVSFLIAPFPIASVSFPLTHAVCVELGSWQRQPATCWHCKPRMSDGVSPLSHTQKMSTAGQLRSKRCQVGVIGSAAGKGFRPHTLKQPGIDEAGRHTAGNGVSASSSSDGTNTVIFSVSHGTRTAFISTMSSQPLPKNKNGPGQDPSAAMDYKGKRPAGGNCASWSHHGQSHDSRGQHVSLDANAVKYIGRLFNAKSESYATETNQKGLNSRDAAPHRACATQSKSNATLTTKSHILTSQSRARRY